MASELTAAGLKAGPITAAAFNITSKFSTIAYSGFTIKLGCSNLTALSSFVTGLTTVYSTSVTTATGVNNYNFTTNYKWDGTSNLIMEVCYDNSSYTGYDHVTYSTTSFNSTIYNRLDASTGCTLGSPTTSTRRPNITFKNCELTTYTWSPGSTLTSTTIASPFAKPTTTTTYNVTVSSSGCTLTGSTTVTIAAPNAGPDQSVACYLTGSATFAASGIGTWS